MEGILGNSKISIFKLSQCTRRELWCLTIVLLVGLCLRFGWALSHYERKQPDEQGYYQIALNLLETGTYCVYKPDGVLTQTAFKPPGWPWLTSLAYRVAGTNIKVGRSLTALLGTLIILATFLLARELFGSRAALWSSCIVALHPILIYWSGVMMTETIFALLCSIGLWLEVRRDNSPLCCIISGLLWGFATLIRTTALPIAIALGLLQIAFGSRKWRGSLLFFIALFVLPLFWAHRNYKVLGRYGLDFHGGYTVLIGNMFYKENRVDTDFADTVLKSQTWYKAAESMNEVQRDRYFWRKCREFIVRHPVTTLKQVISKIKQFWRLYPRQDHDMPHSRRLLFWIAILAETPLFVLCLTGMALYGRSWRLWVLMLVPAVILCLIHAISVSQMRYRLPLTPLMAVFAGAGIVGMLDRLRKTA